MSFNLVMPASIDLLHLILGGVAALFFILFLVKGAAQPKSESASTADKKPENTPEPDAAPAESAPKTSTLVANSPDAALQLLSLLQQEARFVDFLNEDLKGFSDEEIGAVARVVHEGGKKTLDQYFTLEPIRTEEEESSITLEEGFDSTENRVTGNVVGQPPFKGVLVHRGWKAVKADLPKLADGHDAHIIAPAEVEL